MINATSIAGMKRGVILVNLARATWWIRPRWLRLCVVGRSARRRSMCAIPSRFRPTHPLLAMGNVIVASHVASTSVKASRTLRETAARTALAALQGEPLPNIVNGVKQAT